MLKQIKKFNPKYVFVNNKKKELLLRKLFKNQINLINCFHDFKTIFKLEKIDKTIHGISSIDGIKYSFEFIKYSKQLLIANKESIICGGKLLLSKAKYYGCLINSINSEHYCLSQIIKKNSIKEIDCVYLTASGGPFLKKKFHEIKKARIHDVLKHPKWKMGKKISVDSATLVNKLFEIIEAHILFNIPISKIKIKIHKEALAHCAVVYNNGLIRIILHDTLMTIPIGNSLFDDQYLNKNVNFFKINKSINLSFDENKLKNFEILKVADMLLNNGHVGWILFNVINDILVKKFLNKEIFFYEITDNLIKIFNKSSLKLYCKKKIKNFSDINEIINHGIRLANLNERF